MSLFVDLETDKKRLENEGENAPFLDSMRIFRPATNGVAFKPYVLTSKQKLSRQEVDQLTGEILNFSENPYGSFRVMDDPVFLRLEKWILQSAIRHLLPQKRVSKCCRLRASGQSTVNVFHNPELKSAHFGGTQTCGSVWDDPVCASKISERRRVKEVLPAMDSWKLQGGQCLLWTITNPHYIQDKLSYLLKGQTKAMSLMVESKAFKALMLEMGCIGRIRAWEVTHSGLNGFHPHFHIILFAEYGLCIEYFEVCLYRLWSHACKKAGLSIPDDRFCKLHDGSKAHAYATKGVWGLDHEITKGHLKKSHRGRSPMDLIRSYVYDDDKQAAALFVEYSFAFHRKCQLTWTPGLKARFLIGEMSDDEIAAEQDDKAILLARIEWDVWKLVLKSETRGEIIELARSGSSDAIERLLDGLVNRQKSFIHS